MFDQRGAVSINLLWFKNSSITGGCQFESFYDQTLFYGNSIYMQWGFQLFRLSPHYTVVFSHKLLNNLRIRLLAIVPVGIVTHFTIQISDWSLTKRGDGNA